MLASRMLHSGSPSLSACSSLLPAAACCCTAPCCGCCVRPAGAVCCNLLRPTACALSPLFAASAAAACLQPAAAFACSLFLSACSPLLLAVCCGCGCNLLRLLLQPAGATCLQHAVLSAACCRGCCMWPADADCSQPVMLFVQRDVLRCSLLLLPHACNLPLFCMQATVAAATCCCCTACCSWCSLLVLLLAACGAGYCSLPPLCSQPAVADVCLQTIVAPACSCWLMLAASAALQPGGCLLADC